MALIDPEVAVHRISSFWRSTAAIFLGLSALSLIVFFPDLGGRPIWQIDQVQRAQAAVEMLRTGDWVVPRVGGAPFAYYPPMGYWTIAAPALVLGMSDGVARLPSAVAGWLAVLVLFWIGSRLMDRARGAAVAAILALTPGFVHIGRIVYPDMLLVLCQMLLLALFLEWLGDGADAGVHPYTGDTASGRVRYLIILGMIFAGGVGILAKGPVAVAFPFVAGMVYLAFTRRLSLLWKFPWVTVTLGMGFLVLPWCLAVASRPEGRVFFDKFINENFRAPTGQDLHVNGPLYYVLRMPPRALPWVLLLPAALLDGSWTRKETRFGWCWLLPVLAALSASASKRPTYFVFLFPPLALLLGDAAVRLWRGEAEPRAQAVFRATLVLLAVACAVFAGILLFHPRPFRDQPWFDHRQALAAAAGGVALLVGVIAGCKGTGTPPRVPLEADEGGRRGPPLPFARVPLAFMGVAALIGLFVHAAWIERTEDPEELRAAAFCRRVEDLVPPGETLWTLTGLHPKFRYNIRRQNAVWPPPYDPAPESRFVLVTFDAPKDAICLADTETLAEEVIEREERTRLVRTKEGR